MREIRVLLVEDDPFWQREIGKLIRDETDMRLLATVGSKDEAMRFVRSHETDVALIDVVLSANRLDGLDAALELGASGKAKVVMLTSVHDDHVVAEAFSYGAANFVTKEHYRDIPDVIRSAVRGENRIHPSASRGVLRELVRLKQAEREKLLSNSEKEILRLIHDGLTYSQIESRLYIAERTIKNHVNRILKKMKVKSGKEAAMQAKLKGMI